MDCAARIAQATADYRRANPEGDRSASREMVRAFRAMFRALLPGAPQDVIASMVELASLETAHARLRDLADSGRLPSAKVIDLADVPEAMF